MKKIITSPIFIILFCLIPALVTGQKKTLQIQKKGGRIEQQLIVEYSSWKYAMQDYDAMQNDGGIIIDSCGCDRPIYLWQFESLDKLIEIDTKVQSETTKADVDSDGNQRISVPPITRKKASGNWRIKHESSGDYSTKVNVYVLDTGLSTNGWNNDSNYLHEKAPIGKCYPIQRSRGYNYLTNNREVIDTNFNDMHSPGHGTIGASGTPIK